MTENMNSEAANPKIQCSPFTGGRHHSGGTPSRLDAIRDATAGIIRADLPGTNEAGVERAGDEADRVMETIQPTAPREAGAMLALILASEGDDLAEPVRSALANIMKFLEKAKVENFM